MAVRTDSPQSVGKHFARQACHTERWFHGAWLDGDLFVVGSEEADT